MKWVARQIAGWFFIVLGIVGLFLPILQGVLFILVGMFILARDIPLFHRMITRLEERYPALFAKVKSIHVDIVERFRKMVTGFTKCRKPRARDRHTGTDE